MKLMIIESPGKREKLQQILSTLHPNEVWRIEASLGHIRDLPVKGQEAGHIVTGVAGDFSPIYELSDRGKKIVSKLKTAVKEADEVYLATDPDREGEAISWHLEQCLGLKNSKKAFRVSFKDITEGEVKRTLSNPGKIDQAKVASQEGRRVLDRLVGYMVSPELRRLTAEPLSAGRVQSPAVRLIVEREREIARFKPTKHFGARVIFAGAKKSQWFADWLTSPDYVSEDSPYFMDREFADRVAACRNFIVESFEQREASRNPPPPFITSTLQQAASNVFGHDPRKTMQLAQSLYEQGHITYHRTDNPNVSEESMDDIRAIVSGLGLQCVGKRRAFQAKEGAQEGHPAITPTHWDEESAGKTEEERELYKLLRVRALASQLQPAKYAVRTAVLRSLDLVNEKGILFEAKGRALIEAGWMKLLASDATEEEGDKEEENTIPDLEVGRALQAVDGFTQEKTTRAPPRYTRASFLKAMERYGIGRPATYAQILENIETRDYIRKQKKYLYPTPTGEKIVDLLVGNYEFININFTRELEEELDLIVTGQSSYTNVIRKLHDRLKQEIEGQRSTAPIAPSFPCPVCQKPLRRINGQNGKFWGCTGYPECRTTLPDAEGKPGKPKASGNGQAATGNFKCLKCGKPLVHKFKKGKAGFDFFGCSGYSTGCKATYRNLNGQPDYKQAM